AFLLTFDFFIAVFNGWGVLCVVSQYQIYKDGDHIVIPSLSKGCPRPILTRKVSAVSGYRESTAEALLIIENGTVVPNHHDSPSEIRGPGSSKDSSSPLSDTRGGPSSKDSGSSMVTETPPSSNRELNINPVSNNKDLHPLHPDYVPSNLEEDKLTQNNNKTEKTKRLKRDSKKIRKVQFL
ncbi:unnamed protein product, partial [Meganyctiphanes norvegica]